MDILLVISLGVIFDQYMGFTEALEALEEVTEDQMYCSTETFSPDCGPDGIIILDFAYYGRMRMGRCVEVDFGFIGCHADVTRQADRRCSGRRECEIRIPDAAFNEAITCMGDLIRYFEGVYHCQPVITVPADQCQTSAAIRVLPTQGMLASIVTTETGCGARNHPWVIEVEPSQKINLTLFDFFARESPSSSHLPCTEYVVLREDLTGEVESVCRGVERVRHIYTSTTNRLEVEFPHAQSNTDVYFAVYYEAVGCTTPTLPGGMTVRNYGDYVIVGCESSSVTWRLECYGNQWQGSIGNCSSPGYAIAIIIAIAVTISAIILVIGVLYMGRCNRNQRARHPGPQQTIVSEKGVYYSKCNMEYDGTIRQQLRHHRMSNPIQQNAGTLEQDTQGQSERCPNDYSHKYWTQAPRRIPSYTGGTERPYSEHIYESPVFGRKNEMGPEDRSYFELDPEQVHVVPPNNQRSQRSSQSYETDTTRRY